jgi:hypothetical protein
MFHAVYTSAGGRPRRAAALTPERFSDLVDTHHAVIARLDRAIK